MTFSGIRKKKRLDFFLIRFAGNTKMNPTIFHNSPVQQQNSFSLIKRTETKTGGKNILLENFVKLDLSLNVQSMQRVHSDPRFYLYYYFYVVYFYLQLDHQMVTLQAAFHSIESLRTRFKTDMS